MEWFHRLFGGSSAGLSGAGLSAQEAQSELARKPRPVLVDVRQPEEFRSGHIPGARLIPLGELPKRMHELPKDREIICVCRSGNRSGTAVRQLTQAGFQARNLNGGMIAWSRAAYPVKKA